MKIFIVLHHEIMGTPEDCGADEMVFYTCDSLKKTISLAYPGQSIYFESLACSNAAINTSDDCAPDNVILLLTTKNGTPST